MRNALITSLSLSLSATPLGLFMVLKRMGLMGEALSHGILPGIATAFMISGLTALGMTIGGMIAGILVALLSLWITKKSDLPEDSSLSAMYIIFLSLGFLLLSIADSGVHLTHILFGNILAIDRETLNLVLGLSGLTFLIMVFATPYLLEIFFDPTFSKLKGFPVSKIQSLFFVLIVINLVAACQAIGTLMALGVMLLPSIAARLLAEKFYKILGLSIILSFLGSFLGILLSFHFNLPTGPMIVLCLGCFFFFSLVIKKAPKLALS